MVKGLWEATKRGQRSNTDKDKDGDGDDENDNKTRTKWYHRGPRALPEKKKKD